jgi:hypothetical protein
MGYAGMDFPRGEKEKPKHCKWRKTSEDPDGKLSRLKIELKGKTYLITNAAPPLAFPSGFSAVMSCRPPDSDDFDAQLTEFSFGDLKGTLSPDGKQIEGSKGPKSSNRAVWLDGGAKREYSLTWSFRRMRRKSK